MAVTEPKMLTTIRDADVVVYYTFEPGQSGTWDDPPYEASVEIGGVYLLVNGQEVPVDLVEMLSDEIIHDLEAEAMQAERDAAEDAQAWADDQADQRRKDGEGFSHLHDRTDLDD